MGDTRTSPFFEQKKKLYSLEVYLHMSVIKKGMILSDAVYEDLFF